MKRRPLLWALPLVAALVLGPILVVWLGARPAHAALCESNGSGNWSNPGTWINCGGVYPGQTTNDYVRIRNGHTVTLDISPGAVYFVEIQTGGTLTFGGANVLKISAGGGTPGLANNGTLNAGSGTVHFNTDYGLAGSTVSGACVLNNVILSGVGVDFGPATTVNGTLTINSGGWVNTNPPLYGNSSTLRYNTGGVYGRNVEWSSTSGVGYPYHVQISNNTGLDLGANGGTGTARALAGNLTIDAGSGLYMDYGANDMTAPLTVGGDVIINGTLSLSELVGGDLAVRGSWSNNNTFNCRGRQVTFNGGGAQSLGGSVATTFDYLLIDNLVAGEVTLAGNIVVRRELKINDSSAELSAGSATITMQGDAGAAPVWINNGAFNRGTGTVVFNGENEKHARVLGSAVTTFHNVTLNRNGGGSGNFGVDFYDHDTSRRAHIAGTLTLNLQTFVASEEDGSSTSCAPSNCDGTPVYDAGSTLRYNNTASFDSGAEWWPDDLDPLCGADKGMPYNVVIDNSTTVNIHAAFTNNGQSPNYGAGSNKTACGSVTINGGSTLQATAGILSVKDNWTRGGTFTHNNGTVRFNGNGGSDSTQTVTGDTTFYNLTLAAQSGVTVYFGGTTTTIAHDLDKTGGSGSMDPGTGKFSFTGAPSGILGDGKKVFYDLEIAGGTTNHTSGTGEIYIHHNFTNNGTFNQDSAHCTYFDDEISGSTTVHSLSGSGATTFGKVEVFTLDTLNAGSHSVSIVGSEFWVATGATFNGGTATVTFKNTSAGTYLRGAGAYNFNHLVIDTGAILLGVDTATNNKTFHVAGNWTNNGTYTHNDGAVHFNGTSAIGGTAVTTFFDLLIEAGCSLTGPAGTVNVAHDWTNNGTYVHGSGTVAFNGSTAQVIGGTATTNFYTLNINNTSGGVSLAHTTQVARTLALSSGLLTLGAYDLLMGVGSGYTGTPDATKMVVADGSGALCREFRGMTPMFTYPIGDNTAGANYSPGYLGFFAADPWGMACMRVTDAKHPDNPSAVDYLTRYWTVTSPPVGGIGNFNCVARLWYVAGAEDVTGTETSIYNMKYDSGVWTYGDPLDVANHRIVWWDLTSFSDITGGSAPTAVRLVSFAGRPAASGVLLTWETASEHANVGFHLYRSAQPGVLGERVNAALIPSRAPGGGQGAAYEWLDAVALPGATYYYTLEDVDVNGARTAHGPVVVRWWRAYLPVVGRW